MTITTAIIAITIGLISIVLSIRSLIKSCKIFLKMKNKNVFGVIFIDENGYLCAGAIIAENADEVMEMLTDCWHAKKVIRISE